MQRHTSGFFTYAVEQLQLQSNTYVIRFEAHSPGVYEIEFPTSSVPCTSDGVTFRVEKAGYTRVRTELDFG
jgi:hypothetical protein